MEIESKEDLFEFEKKICLQKPEIWLNESLKLFGSAAILMEFSRIQAIGLFDKSQNHLSEFSEKVRNGHIFSYRIIRMLWAYGFENISKGIIVSKLKSTNPNAKEVPLNDIKSHNLKYLIETAGISLDNNDLYYLAIWEKCSVWMGRYPLPVKQEQMFEQRKGSESRAELLQNSIDRTNDYLDGKIPRMSLESDTLHGAIGSEEENIFNSLRERTQNIFPK